MTVAIWSVVALTVAWAVLALARSTRAAWAEATEPVDGPYLILAVACRRLPADHADWGPAMLAELERVPGRLARWQFAMGGVRAALTARVIGRVLGRPSLTIVLCGLVACAGVVAAALISHPQLWADRKISLFLVVLVVALGGCGMLATAAARRAGAGVARRTGAAAGLVVGATWLIFAAAWWNLHGVPMLLALLLPVLIGAVATWLPGGVRSGLTAVIWAALVAGPAVFLGNAIDSWVTAAGPYDLGQLDEFAHSGQSSSTAYWLGEGLATSLVLLVVASSLTVLLGGIGVAAGHLLRPRPAGPGHEAPRQ